MIVPVANQNIGCLSGLTRRGFFNIFVNTISTPTIAYILNKIKFNEGNSNMFENKVLVIKDIQQITINIILKINKN